MRSNGDARFEPTPGTRRVNILPAHKQLLSPTQLSAYTLFTFMFNLLYDILSRAAVASPRMAVTDLSFQIADDVTFDPGLHFDAFKRLLHFRLRNRQDNQPPNSGI